MTEGPREKAKSLLDAGKPRDAAELLLASGDVDAAADMLADAHFYVEASQVLLNEIGVDVTMLSGVSARERKQAMKAAGFLVRAGSTDQTEQAATIYEALGDRDKASRLFVRAGQTERAADVRAGRVHVPSEAARLEKAGRYEDAVQLLVSQGLREEAARVAKKLPPRTGAAVLCQLGRFLEAALLCLQEGDKSSAYECLLMVPPTDPDYNDACRNIVELVWPKRFLDDRLATFFVPWTRATPTRDDFQSLCRLATLMAEHGRIPEARDVYSRIAGLAPDYQDATDGLITLAEPTTTDDRRGKSSDGSSVFRRVQKTDAGLAVLASSSSSSSSSSSKNAASPAASAAALSKEATGFESVRSAEVERLTRRVDELRPDLVINGRYRLKKKIGGGGMGVVFEAVDEELSGDTVALKFLLPLDDSTALQRFKREIALTRRLSHPNIVRVFDIGVYEDTRYVTMELLRGEDLWHRMQRPIDVPQALDVLAQACRGLFAAHTEGIIHRDVKPANIFICTGGAVKMMDFGIAREATTGTITQTGILMGTPRYMAPEYFLGTKALGPKADLYAIGVTAYELFTGDAPFSAAEPLPLLMKHVSEMPIPPQTIRPELPDELNALILRLLAKKPDERHADANEVANAFDAVRQWAMLNAPTRADDQET